MRLVEVANPPNPWSSTEIEYLEAPPTIRLQVFEDHTKEILSHNDSPDLGFSWSVNPYRGCMHGCAYCYARPSHEYLSFGAGTDFETKIVVKPEAPSLLRAAFDRRSWKGELVVFSGVTDCYQPLEASLKLTRGCLEACAEYRNPVGVITKAPLIERDLDVLQELHRHARVHVSVSVPFWDQDKARAVEPYVATPRRRIQAIEALARAGIPVGVNVAPVIPGLSDQDMPKVLTAAAAAGATYAGMVMVRLPGSVKQVFEERIRAALPLQAERILHRVREVRGGKLYDSRWGTRGRGEGLYADATHDLFRATCQKLGLNSKWGQSETSRYGDPEAPTTFRRPAGRDGQLTLFD
ncbi:MAG TPA: PA0069 family radical SAM protein [Myxococcaceae bacterium]|jgi:DNA repair photolyase